ncbi:MAG TPA: DUF4331 family protein [Chthoniobacteraceae bacterium]|nr:DUF4331 family protein [Chthoniobacteraceae bacterium]
MTKPTTMRRILLAAILPLTLNLAPSLRASDHADGPTVAGDQAADLADCYMFVDPTDPTKIVLINTVRGFIVPGEAGNFALFDSTIRYRFQVENTDDEKPDAFIDVTFSEKVADETGAALQQTATVAFSGDAFDGIKGKHTGLTTNPGLGATPPGGANYFPDPAQKLKDSKGDDSTVEFFAGETDDPFFFDIPGFIRFRNSVLAGTPDASHLTRGRDTFAGYNVMTIAFRLPIDALKSKKASATNETKFGLNVLAQRGTERTSKGRKIRTGSFKTVDREGLPAVNALLVPLNVKNAYNGGTTIDDAKLKFAPAIVGTLTALGTSEDNINALAGLAVAKGDVLRIDIGSASGFPNGRLPADDVVKTLLSIITNQVPPATLDDSVAANEKPFETRFPYLGLPHQPRNPGEDDQTAN